MTGRGRAVRSAGAEGRLRLQYPPAALCLSCRALNAHMKDLSAQEKSGLRIQINSLKRRKERLERQVEEKDNAIARATEGISQDLADRLREDIDKGQYMVRMLREKITMQRLEAPEVEEEDDVEIEREEPEPGPEEEEEEDEPTDPFEAEVAAAT